MSDDAGQMVVLDTETSWVRSLIAALPPDWSARVIGTRSVGFSPSAWLSALRADSPPLNERITTHLAGVPGWTRAAALSTWLTARTIGAAPTTLVHTTPWTAGLIRRFPTTLHVYRPHDYFGMYSWDQDKVAAHERTLMSECRLVLPVSSAHAEDLRALGNAPVHVLPNGVSSAFVQRLREPGGPCPDDLADERRPIVGCVGQINTGYDLPLLGELADRFPDAAFVFIGPIFDEGPERRRWVDAIFDRPNVRWLGPKPHDELPNYLHRFAVCLNPLQENTNNDRRSPLRLYDYLATGKPVLSTAIRAAIEHSPHVAVGRDAQELANQLHSMLDADYRIDSEARRDYVDANTWEARAASMVALLNEITR